MQEINLYILPVSLPAQYRAAINQDIKLRFEKLHDAEISTPDFSFYTSVSSVFSSKIEGEEVDLDSYIKYKRFGVEYTPDYTKKIDDLYNAYLFARQSALSKDNIVKAHIILSEHFLAKHLRGKTRKQNMNVTTPDGRIEYIAAEPVLVESEMEKLYHDIDLLIKAELDFKETFYFASLIHLVFVKIHPFNDGNGRTGRLLEKWFLAQKLGSKAWFIQSEKHYYQYHQTYYNNIRALGLEYSELNYNKALPFLLMLKQSLLGPEDQ